MYFLQPKYKIITNTFCDKINKILLTIQAKTTRGLETITDTADRLSLNKKILNRLSQEDAHRIGYIAGYEHAFITSLRKDATE